MIRENGFLQPYMAQFKDEAAEERVKKRGRL